MKADVWNKLIVALDSGNKEKTRRIVKELLPRVKKFKVGLVAYTLGGPNLVEWIRALGGEVFLDLKLYDIPNTMAKTARIMTCLGVWAITVHIKAGRDALQRTKDEVTAQAKKSKISAPLIIGVTELTSSSASLKKVLRLAEQGQKSGIDGVVCSVWEAKEIKKRFKKFCVITPGIRNISLCDDQKRVATVKDALDNKVDYFVVGRPIIEKESYLKATEAILFK